MELDDGRDPVQLSRHLARKSLLAVAEFVSVHDDTWTTDRTTAAARWGEIEPSLASDLHVPHGRRGTRRCIKRSIRSGCSHYANPTRITPYVTLALIAVNLLIFLIFQFRASQAEQTEFVYERAAIACEVTSCDPLDVEEIITGQCGAEGQGEVFPGKNVYLALVVSMFLHGSVGHVLFNMWFLWIFGNNVEEAYGHVGYAVLYVIGGLVATAAFIALNIDTTIPLVGASGAIAAVMGSYAVLFPRHRVTSLVGWFILPLPAAIFLVIWFVAQFGLGGTGVAWEAHAGGFVVGVAATLFFRDRLLTRVAAA